MSGDLAHLGLVGDTGVEVVDVAAASLGRRTARYGGSILGKKVPRGLRRR